MGLVSDMSFGVVELFLIVVVFAITVAGPLAVIGLVLYLGAKKKKTEANTRKCPFCAYAIPTEATVCGVCRRDLPI